MLRLVRARACCLVTALLLAASTTSAALGELLHAGQAHDVACVVPVGDAPHDASSHRYRADKASSAQHEHCVGCHLARAPRLEPQSAAIAGHADEEGSLRPIAALGSLRSVALENLPPRSPPYRS